MRARRILSILVLGVVGINLVPIDSVADGGFFYAPEWILQESSQTAVIQLEDGREDLRILPGFQGDARDFAWIVPVPSLPELTTTNRTLFTELTRMTQPLRRYRDSDWGCTSDDIDYVASEGNVDIIAEELVGIYRTMILAASAADALTDSLTAWNFLHASNTATVLPVLQSYVDRGWYFVTMKVDQAVLEEGHPDLGNYWYGEMQPIRLTFDSDEMVYPLRISSLSSANSSEIVLYTIADHRMDYPGAETWYANRITVGELAAIRRQHPSVATELSVGDFITKLKRTYAPEEMGADLVLERAASDDEFRPINYSGVPLFNLFLAGSMVGWLGWKWKRRRRRKAER